MNTSRPSGLRQTRGLAEAAPARVRLAGSANVSHEMDSHWTCPLKCPVVCLSGTSLRHSTACWWSCDKWLVTRRGVSVLGGLSRRTRTSVPRGQRRSEPATGPGTFYTRAHRPSLGSPHCPNRRKMKAALLNVISVEGMRKWLGFLPCRWQPAWHPGRSQRRPFFLSN